RIASGSSQWSIGVLVQSNFGGILQVLGAPVGKALGRKSGSDAGSIVIVVATDAPLSERNLGRLAARAMIGLGRTGSSLANGSGDYAIAFSTAPEVRRPWRASMPTFSEVSNDRMNPLFQAVVEATEEAIYNSIFAATTVSGNGATVEAIPLDAVAQVLERHGIGAPAPEDTDSTSPPQEDS
ncbi:MAG TPA: P1 family peptidase, partial [Burkholderiaceae bacterium]|nr:P1 family peptidase [Burkholderiaceae bacterium]